MTATPPPLPARARGRDPDGIRGAHPDATNLARLRWAVRAALTLGVTASVAANVLHARPNLISQIIAAWPPLALLLTVELISRVPAHRRGLATARLLAAAVIAGIAAWVSYFHMAGVAARYGETDAAAAYLLPVSVDGLVVVASISLVEIAGRIRAFAHDLQPVTMPVQAPPASDEQAGRHPPAPAFVPASDTQMTTQSRPVPAARPPATATVDLGATAVQAQAVGTTSARGSAAPAGDDEPVQPPAYRDDGPQQHQTSDTGPDSDLPAPAAQSDDSPGRAQGTVDVEDADSDATGDGDRDGDDRDGDGNLEGVVPSDTAAAVAYWYRRDPSMHPADIAAKIGRSERTVRRYWPPAPQTANGHDASRLAEQLRTS